MNDIRIQSSENAGTRADHLPIVALFCRRNGLIEIVNRMVPNKMELDVGNQGTCYQAANWTWGGCTRNDRRHRIATSVKDVYIYPLNRHFRRGLCR